MTEALARPLARRLGLSRAVEITRCDRLGLPVFVVTRPDGRAPVVHAGKGWDAAGARIGALMEGIEHAVAARAAAEAPAVRLALGELARRWPGGLRPEHFAPRVGAALDLARIVDAVKAEQLGTRRAAWLPAELFWLPGPPSDAQAPYGGTGNGLASGNSLQEATLHALLEVLERDAIAMDTARSEAARLDDTDYPAPLGHLAERWAGLGVALMVRVLPSAFGLPCFEATLHEPAHPLVPLAGGWGLHPDRAIALARAVAEAAQSRACALFEAGSGGAAAPDASPPRQRGMAWLVHRLAADHAPRMRFGEVPQLAATSVRDALAQVLARVHERGFGPVFRRQLPVGPQRPGRPALHVVQLVVAHCENVLGPHRRMGPRLLARVLGAPRP